MLNTSIWEKEQSAHGTYVLAHCVTHEFGQPVAREDDYVIVQEDDDAAACVLNAKIVDRRVVERARVPNHTSTSVKLQLGQIRQRCVVIRIVVDDDHFEVRIRRLLEDALNSRREQIYAVPGWDDQ